MSLQEALTILTKHQQWRRGADIEMAEPKVITEALDIVLAYHHVGTNEMVKRGTLKKRMDKDAWFVVFQSNAYNESDMAYELIKSQEIDIDMYDVYKDGDEVTFEVVNKKWAKITPFLYPFKTTSSQTEISDEEIEKGADYYGDRWIDAREAFYGFLEGAKWYREQVKSRQ